MNKYTLLQDVIEKLSLYESSVESSTEMNLNDFAAYLATNNLTNFSSTKINNNGESSDERDQRLNLKDTPTDIEQAISQNLVFLYRYAKQYIKKALKNSELKTIDEFSYLATLLNFETLNKIDLITKSVQEKTTGMETIKRLLKNNLIEQFDNPIDQRSQCLRLTDKGKIVLYGVFEDMSMVGKVIGGNLNPIEKTQLAYLLKKLDTHHNTIYLNKKNWELKDLIF